MDLLNMTNRLKRQHLMFQATVLKFCNLLGGGSCQRMPNFSTICSKSCLLGHETQRNGV